MVGLHHRLNKHEFEQAPGDGEGTGNPGVLQSMGSQRVKHTERLNNNPPLETLTNVVVMTMKFNCIGYSWITM